MVGQKVLVGLILITTFASLAKSCCFENECNCEPNCWEKCFMNPPNGQAYRHAYMEIYRAAMGIRNLYAPCFKPHGTAYMMDADLPTFPAPAATYAYQRQLASIVAMVQPVGEDCNPFCASKFHQFFAWYAHNWPCQSRCETWRFFQTNPGMTSYNNQPAPSWVRGGEILSRLCFNRPQLNGHRCMRCTKNELLIAFTNSAIIPPPSSYCGGNPYNCAAIGVSPATYANMDAWTNTGPAYHLPNTVEYRRAAGTISKCMFLHCCKYVTRNTWTKKPTFPGIFTNPNQFNPNKPKFNPRSLENEEEEEEELDRQDGEQVFSFINLKDEDEGEKAKEFKGTLDEFNAKVVRPALGGSASDDKPPKRG